MFRVLFALALISGFAAPAHADNAADEIVSTRVREVTEEYANSPDLAPALNIASNPDLTNTVRTLGTPAPSHSTTPPASSGTTSPSLPVASGPSSSSPSASPASGSSLGSSIGSAIGNQLSGITLGQLITLGEKIWDFIITNRPSAQFQTISTSIVPSGITNWTQLRGWQRPVSKVYRVEFQNIFGGTAGSFDYRISFVPGGSYNGKGKFLGQITVLPMNIQLHTDRTLDVKAALSDPLNFGTETDPVAAAQVVVSWATPTTTRYQMNSAEYFIYGTGEIEDLTNGTP